MRGPNPRQSRVWLMLPSSFQRIAEEDPNTLIKIQADIGVTHGAVVQMMDMARAAGLNRLAIATDTSGLPNNE